MRDLNRRSFLRSVAAGAGVLAGPGPKGRRVLAAQKTSNQPAGKKPNVVLVMTDDQGYGDLGCHGNKIIKTPNLDKLHGQSVRLTDFHVAPTCSPTRAGLMTGRSCNRTGVWHTIMGRSLLRGDEVTVADVFQAGGYRTGAFGKWHLGDNYPSRPQDHGFAEVLVHGGGGVGQTPDYWGNNYFDDTYCHNGKWEKFKGYCTDVFFDGALKFIEESKSAPFFCYIPTNVPHSPYLVAKKYSDMYAGKKAPAAFYGMLTNFDENMGRLMAKLNELKLADNTILIFLTDNGSSAGARVFNAGMRAGKGSEYDGGHRVPCFIRWPAGGLGGGKDISRLTANIDLLPTLADLCGLKKPKGPKLEGTSLVPLLVADRRKWPDRILITDSQRIETPQKWRKSAVMTDRWRLINGKALYDMKADPAQKNNVAGEHGDVVEKLREAYEKWWAETSKRFGEYCEIILGSDKENPSRLTCHDWHGGGVPWNQGAIRSGRKANGFWAVEVERDGRYEFALRRWPQEVDKPITGAVGGRGAIKATKARLKIADIDQTKAIEKDAVAAVFRVKLKAGKTKLRTWFNGEKGASRGAFYVYVKRLG
ncbi:MAG: arylsulfatase [Phycisphaerae bacterium]|nr:arylsulfatase [Phycisphaerae bacterium]